MDLTMGAAGGDPNSSLSVLVMNQSDHRSPPYSPVATATMAIGITAMMLFTIFGNILVIIAVLTSRSLRGPQNLFLVSLAAADILVATLIIPFSLANELMGYWYFRTVWCEIYLALDVFFCTSSIAHLCAISLDRYLSVSRPVAYTARRTAARVKAAIVVVWLIAAVISFPPLLSIEKNQEEDEPGSPQCKLNSDRWYILYSTIGSFFAPCLIMILVYVRIYQIAKRHTRCPPGEPRRDVGSSSTTASPQRGVNAGSGFVGGGGGEGQHNGAVGLDHPEYSTKEEGGGETDGAVSRPPTLDIGPSSSQCPAQGDASATGPRAATTSQVTQQPMPPLNDHAPPLSSYATSSNAPQQQPEVLSKPKQQRGGKKQAEAYNDDSSSPESDNDTPENHGTNGTPAGCSGPRALAQKCRGLVVTSKGTQLAKVAVKTSGTPNTARRKALVNREKRFTFVLAVVIGVFVVCWFPFFFSYSLKAICPKTCTLPEPLFNFFFWIGYCNSSLNPLIYTIFNKDFRKAFKKILCKDMKNSAF